MCTTFQEQFHLHWVISQLVHLNISFNNLWGELPISIGNLGSLRRPHAYNYWFSGQISSSLGKVTQLNHLELASNIFSGKNPSSLSWLSKLIELTTLDLSSLNLAGVVPLSLMNLTQLTHLVMSDNQLMVLSQLGSWIWTSYHGYISSLINWLVKFLLKLAA